MEKNFLKDGQVKAKMIPRLNGWHDAEDWLSMQPSAQYQYKSPFGAEFGELNDDNELHGRGIEM